MFGVVRHAPSTYYIQCILYGLLDVRHAPSTYYFQSLLCGGLD